MVPPLQLSNDLLLALTEQAEQSLPEECCGILLGRRTDNAVRVAKLRASPNVSPDDRTRHYQIDSQLLMNVLLDHRLRREGVVGFYHSHPDGACIPSATDLDTAWPGKSFLIAGVRDGGGASVRSWVLDPRAGQWREQPIQIV